MDREPRTVRRLLLSLAVLALLWAAIVSITGGVGVTLAGVRLSSRNARNPVLVALVSACAAAMLAGRKAGDLAQDLRWLAMLAASAITAWSRRRWARWLDLATVTAFGGATLIVVHWLRARPLWLDEEMTLLNVRDRALADLAGMLWLEQSAPLGWLAMERAVMHAFGLGETAVRAVPALVGVAAVAIAAWVGRRWMTAVGAGALVAMSSLGLWMFHYSLEAKPYSGDTLFGLLLPALVVWAIEADTPRQRLRRAAIWWAIAALAQWWAYGALFAAPACAVALWVALWRIDGRRRATAFALFGIGWLVAFGINYGLVLRFTLENDALREYWAVVKPPESGALRDIIAWLVAQPALLADTPGGTTLATLFWATAVSGFVLARRRVIGYVFGAVPLSAFLLGVAGILPLYGRLSLWAAPALYVGIASCVDSGAWRLRHASTRAQPARVVVATMLLVAGVWVSFDIIRRGWREIVAGFPPDSNHAYDDRSGVRWLLAQRRPGDAVLATHFSLPGVWWYGGIPLSPPANGGALPDGSPLFEVFRVASGDADCDLRRLLAPHSRALLYMGFPDRPEGFDDQVLRDLARAGEQLEVRRFSTFTLAAVFALHPNEASSAADQRRAAEATRPDGCVSVRPARRW
jgi:hypothetical protein